MKKYIYLVLGFVLFFGSISAGFDFKPPVDDYSRGYNFGQLSIPIIGLILVFNFFRLSRKERRAKKVEDNQQTRLKSQA